MNEEKKTQSPHETTARGTNTAERVPSPVEGMIGKYVIVRSSQCGCFFGVLVSARYNEHVDRYAVALATSRQLWFWWAKTGVGLAGVAASGLRECDKLRIGATLLEPQEIVDVIQIITPTDAAIKSILAQKATQS